MVEIITQKVGGNRVGKVTKPFSHTEAVYLEEGDKDFDSSHEKCKHCAHYDGNGRCRIVPDISPEGYCEEYFSDVGVFGHKHGMTIEENMVIYGELFDWDKRDVDEFTLDISEMLGRK